MNDLTAAFLNHAERLSAPDGTVWCETCDRAVDDGQRSDCRVIPCAMRDPAAALVRLAWTDTDHEGDLLPHSTHYRRHIAASIDAACDIYQDRTGRVPSEAEMKRARLLLEMETDALIERRDRAAADALADGVEAGDLREDGAVVPWPRYVGV